MAPNEPKTFTEDTSTGTTTPVVESIETPECDNEPDQPVPFSPMLLSLVASHDITSKVTPLTVECPAPTVDTSQSIKPTTQELGEPRDEAKPVGKTEDSHLCALDTETTEDNTKVPPELLGDSALIECINENTSEAHETVMTSESCTAENAITPIVTGMDHESNTAQKEDITPRGSSNELISKSTSSDGTMVDQVRALSFSLVAILASL